MTRSPVPAPSRAPSPAPHWPPPAPRPAPWAPLVTVLVNNYNYGGYLPRAIDSALDQTYPDVQVVVVDDGSTDDSRRVLAGYGDRVTTVLQANAGQASAVYRGLEEAGGELLIVLDSDDVLFPDVVARVVTEFAADPHCVRVQYRLEVVDGAGAPTGALMPPRHKVLREGDLSGLVARRRIFYPPPTSGNAYLTQAVRTVPRTAPELRTHVDRWWSDLTTMLGTVRALDGVGGQYRVHSTNMHSQEGRSLTFFENRIRLTELVHAAGVELAAQIGYRGHPASVDAPRDHALAISRLVVHKLGGAPQPVPVWRMTARATWLALNQPMTPALTRLRRAVWVPALGFAPRRSQLARRMVATRYERGAE